MFTDWNICPQTSGIKVKVFRSRLQVRVTRTVSCLWEHSATPHGLRMTPSTLNGTSAVSSSSKTCTRTSCASPCSSGISSLPTASARHFFSWISSIRNTDAYSFTCVFSDFLGRTEVPVATIKKDQDGKGPLTRRLLLHEVPTGEVRVRLDLQLYEQTPFFWPRICRMKQLLFFFSLIKKPISPLGEQTDRTRERVRSRLRGTGEKRLNSLVQRLAAGQKVDPNQVLTQHDREVENLTWLSI